MVELEVVEILERKSPNTHKHILLYYLKQCTGTLFRHYRHQRPGWTIDRQGSAFTPLLLFNASKQQAHSHLKSSSNLIEDNQLLQDKKKIRGLIEELSLSSWISVAVGPFPEMIKSGLWGIDAEDRKATIRTGAVGKVSTSSVTHTGQAIAAVLSLPERNLSRYKNKAFYVPSFHLAQKKLLQAVQKATGTTDQDWGIDYQDVNDGLKDCNDKIQQKDATAPFVTFFITHFREGSRGDFESKVDVSEVKKLREVGLQKEAIDDVLKRIVS